MRRSFLPVATASNRLWTCSFEKMCWQWLRTVQRLTDISSAISEIVNPLCMSANTSASLRVSGLHREFERACCRTKLFDASTSGWHRWTKAFLPGLVNNIRELTVNCLRAWLLVKKLILNWLTGLLANAAVCIGQHLQQNGLPKMSWPASNSQQRWFNALDLGKPNAVTAALFQVTILPLRLTANAASLVLIWFVSAIMIWKSLFKFKHLQREIPHLSTRYFESKKYLN